MPDILINWLSMILSGEYLYSIAAIFSLAAYLLGNMLWLRVLLIFAALFYIISGITLGLTSMVGWNSAYLAINVFHVILLLLDKNTIALPAEIRSIYQQVFSIMSTREFKKLIMKNSFEMVKNESIILEGEVTDRLYIILDGKVEINHSGKTIAELGAGDLIGEMSFISNEPASATVLAVGLVKYAYWTHSDLERLQRKNSHLYNKFISIIGRDLVKKLKDTSLSKRF